MKTAVVLFNLGGPTDQESIKPFLFNLFYDPAIIQLPNPFRYLLAKVLSLTRASKAAEIYKHLGNKSPLLENTQKQAQALEEVLPQNHQVFIAMRYWVPRAEETIRELEDYQPDHVIFLPLYPQFSMTTTGSSFSEFEALLTTAFPDVPVTKICCYPDNPGFIDAAATLIQDHLRLLDLSKPYRILFSAHGLPKKVILQGDPYQMQVEKTVEALVKKLAIPSLDYSICYQSRVGPLEWIGPPTEHEIIKAGKDKVQVVMVPVAFVSEHSETLVELDIEYDQLAQEEGVPKYVRVPTVSINEKFLKGLADLVKGATLLGQKYEFYNQRICPTSLQHCINSNSCSYVPKKYRS